MTDRYNSVVVAFDRDIREDDAQALLNAIRMLKGVIAVDPQTPDCQTFVAEARIRRELTNKLYDALK